MKQRLCLSYSEISRKASLFRIVGTLEDWQRFINDTTDKMLKTKAWIQYAGPGIYIFYLKGITQLIELTKLLGG